MSAENAWRIAMKAGAEVCDRDADWSAFGRAQIEQWDGGPDEVRDYRLGLAAARAVGATIRTLPMPPAFRAAVEAETEELRRMLADMANDLEAYIRADYGWPDVHPAMQKKYERDMRDVEKARAIVSRLEAKGESHE